MNYSLHFLSSVSFVNKYKYDYSSVLYTMVKIYYLPNLFLILHFEESIIFKMYHIKLWILEIFVRNHFLFAAHVFYKRMSTQKNHKLATSPKPISFTNHC